MQYVYVVTVSQRGDDRGEFFARPTACESQTAAELAAFSLSRSWRRQLL